MEVECSIHSWATTNLKYKFGTKYHLKRNFQLLSLIVETDNSSCSKLLLRQLSLHNITSTSSDRTQVTLLKGDVVLDKIVGFSLNDIEHLEKMIFQVVKF